MYSRQQAEDAIERFKRSADNPKNEFLLLRQETEKKIDAMNDIFLKFHQEMAKHRSDLKSDLNDQELRILGKIDELKYMHNKL